MKLKNICKIFLCICLMAGCSVVSGKDYEQIEITMEELQEKINNKETFIVEIRKDECPYCENVQNYIDETQQEHKNIVLYTLDTTDYDFKSGEEEYSLTSTTDDGNKLLEMYPSFYYTPTFYAYKDGEIVISAVGFNTATSEVSLWDNETVVDFSAASTQSFWSFLGEYQ